jgi:hypothetical protein
MFFGKKLLGEKKKCEIACCCDATASSFDLVLYVFTVTIKVTVVCGTGLPGRILCEQSPWCQRKWWACSWLRSSPVSPFGLSESVLHRVRVMLSVLSLFPRFSQNLILFLCQIHHEITWGQIHNSKQKDIKNTACPTSWVKFCTMTLKIC